MKFDIIISQFDRHNEIGMMLARKFNSKILVILTEDKNKDKLFAMINIYKELLPNCKIEYRIIEIGDTKEISNILSYYRDKNVLINLTGGEVINSLVLQRQAIDFNIKCIYVDLSSQKRYVFGENSRLISQALEDIKIQDIMNLSGISIIRDSETLFKKKELIEISKYILNNLQVWDKYKRILYDKEIFVHYYDKPLRITINKDLLEDVEYKLLSSILDYLKNIEGIKCIDKSNKLEVYFKESYLKGFLFKSGTWLEVLTNLAFKEIGDIDEVKCGVEFFWSKDINNVMNELDVIAIKDSVLICVSCKDSSRYDDEALNELAVNSERIGGREAIKILVATKLPDKAVVLDRAEEMNIKVIIIDCDFEKFRKNIADVISNTIYISQT